MFALHYYFESLDTLHNFVRNLSECTRLNGYFIGCCYDGKTVFKMLENKLNGETITIIENNRKKYELTKLYDETGFADDETSLSYSINIFQDTIGKTFREYLVNFHYFVSVMEEYGFALVPKEQAQQLGLPDGTGMFEEMFDHMENDMKRSKNFKAKYYNASRMTVNEKKISFMNRYFVFQKMNHVNAEKIVKLHMTKKEEMNNEILSKENEEPFVIKKKKRKVIIQE